MRRYCPILHSNHSDVRSHSRTRVGHMLLLVLVPPPPTPRFYIGKARYGQHRKEAMSSAHIVSREELENQIRRWAVVVCTQVQ